ncbi:U-box domain-containing protein 37 [Diplonema papillatum]|nr:U-box domain-containing protein 37 [Diplonema papillatum]
MGPRNGGRGAGNTSSGSGSNSSAKTSTATPSEFNETEEACSLFGFLHGERLRYSRGPLTGETTVIVGVKDGKLWSKDSSGAAPTFFLGRTKDDLLQNYGLVNNDDYEQALQREEEERQASVQMVPVVLSIGDTVEVDVSDAACSRFGVRSGDVLAHQKGSLAGKTTKILGVREGLLYSIDEGADGASFFSARTKAELAARYGIGELPSGSPAEVVMSPRQRRIASRKLACAQKLRADLGFTAADARSLVARIFGA